MTKEIPQPIAGINNLFEWIDIRNIEQQRQVVIFDMDGTLYQLDGNNKGYSGSRLEAKVLNNCRQFIINQEDCSFLQTETIITTGLKDPIGLSNFLSQRYGITRKEYFDIVWDIDPRGLVFNFMTAVQTVKQLSESGKKLVLLTSAPKVWQEKVIKFIGLDKFFEAIYTGEDFGQKQEIFSMIAQRYKKENVLSVGDQLGTDIQPAEKLGLQTLLIGQPEDLEKLLTKTEYDANYH